MSEKFTYSIGEVARHVECCNATIIRYEKKGYLGEVKRSKRGHRRYTLEQRDKMKAIFDARNR